MATEENMIICPKTNNLVDVESCTALKNLSKPMAERFAGRICTTVRGCPNEDYCWVFERGWNAVGSLLQTIKED